MANAKYCRNFIFFYLYSLLSVTSKNHELHHKSAGEVLIQRLATGSLNSLTVVCRLEFFLEKL